MPRYKWGMHLTQRLLALALLATLSALSGCGHNEDESAPPEGAPEALDVVDAVSEEAASEPSDLRAHGETLVPPTEPLEGSQTATLVIPLDPSGQASGSGPFAGIELPKQPTMNRVRAYVGALPKNASDTRESFGASEKVRRREKLLQIRARRSVGPATRALLLEIRSRVLFDEIRGTNPGVLRQGCSSHIE